MERLPPANPVPAEEEVEAEDGHVCDARHDPHPTRASQAQAEDHRRPQQRRLDQRPAQNGPRGLRRGRPCPSPSCTAAAPRPPVETHVRTPRRSRENSPLPEAWSGTVRNKTGRAHGGEEKDPPRSPESAAGWPGQEQVDTEGRGRRARKRDDHLDLGQQHEPRGQTRQAEVTIRAAPDTGGHAPRLQPQVQEQERNRGEDDPVGEFM